MMANSRKKKKSIYSL
jgi:hypothetical protein